MASSDNSGSSGSGSSFAGSSESEDEQQHAQEVVTGANADPQVLQHFWQLASLQQEERQAAAEALVTALVDSQQQYDASHRPPGSMPAGSLGEEAGVNRQQRMEQSLACCSPLMAYGLKRLARGLASGRQGARQGFAAALAATLAHSAAATAGAPGDRKQQQQQQQQQQQLEQPFITAAGVLALLDACLEVTGSMKGTDQRDALLGRVFGLAALTRSGLLSALPVAPADNSSSSSPPSSAVLAATAAVAEQLSGLLSRKSFLRESAAAGLVELLQGLDTEQLASVLAQAPKTTSLLQAPAGQATPESLFLALRLWHALPAQLLQRCQLLPQLPAGQSPPPMLFWEQPAAVKRSRVAAVAAAVFSEGQVAAMGPALLSSTASSPRLHPVWGCLLALLVPGFVPVKGPEQPEQQQKRSTRSPPDLQQLQALWQHFVESSCLSSSHERKALALQLLQLLLPVMEPDAVPVLLGKQLLGCVSTALKDKDSYLHASAKRCLDRLSTAADHNHVIQDDPAAAARLRLALAAALQSANLANPSTRSAKAARLGPLQGLDASGVEDYVMQTLQALVAAAQGSQQQAAAGAAANGAAGGDDDEEAGTEADAADEAKALQQLEQLVAGLKLPAASSDTLRKGLSFLAALAWLQLPPGFDPAAAAAGASAGAAGGKLQAGKKAKKQKQQQLEGAAASGAGAVLSHAAVQEGLRLAASILPATSSTLRQTAAARLVALLHHLQHKASAQAAAAAHHKQQPKQQQKQKEGAAQQPAAAAAQASVQAAEGLAVELLDMFAAAQKLPGVTVTADEDIAEMAEQLGQLAAVVEQHTPSAPAAAAAAATGSSQQQQQATYAARKRVVLHLVRQLQLQLLSGGLAAEAAGSVVDDLEVSVLRGLGLNGQLLEQLRAADAQAKLHMAAAAAEGGSEGEEEAGAGAGSDGDSMGTGDASSEADDDGGSSDDSDNSEDDAWQDVLLDLLLSLLSNSEGGSGSSSSGGGGREVLHVPSVPLREACEGVFKAFAEEMTAQGIADLLRVLSQRASEVLKPTDEEDDEEVEQSEGGDDSSTDGDESSELDEEQQEQLRDLHKKSAAATTSSTSTSSSSGGSESGSESDSPSAAAAANGPATAATAAATAATAAGGSDDGSSSSDDEDLDDAAMLRLDAQLGAAVRASISRGGGGAKERAAALLALQLRVASLLEDWLKKCPRSPILLSVVLPLIKALVAARGPGGNPVLADRLAGLISKHLARTRPVFPTATTAPSADAEAEAAAPAAAAAVAAPAAAAAAVAALEADARKVLYYASRDRDARVAAAAAQSLVVLLVAGSEAGGAAAAVAQASAAAALQDFLQHKKSRLQQSWVTQLLSRCFDAVVGGEAQGLQALLTACSKGRNEAIRSKALQLLPALVAGRQQHPQQAALLLAALKQQQTALLPPALAAGVCGPFRSKEQHAGAVKALVQLLGGVQKLGGGKRLAELLGSEAVRELGKSVVVVKAAGVPPKVEVQLERLVETAGLQQLVAAGKPDPARLALLNKARAALEGGSANGGGSKAAGAAAGAADVDAGVPNGKAAQGSKASKSGSKAAEQSGKNKQQEQGQEGKQQQGKKQQGEQQGKKQKRTASEAAVPEQQQQKQKRKAEAALPKQKEQQPHKEAGQQQQQQRHKKKQKQQHIQEDVAAVAAAAAQAAAAAAGSKGGGSKRKQAGGDAGGGQERPQGKKHRKDHKQQQGKQ